MEIEDIRKELNHLLESIVDHSQKYSDERPIPTLEISFVLSKINKMQDRLCVLKHLLEEKEKSIMKNKKDEKREPVIEVFSKEIKEDSTTSAPILSKESVSLADSLEGAKISKLIDALTLNDRYLYANELFNKDMAAFNDLIKSIDNEATLNEARELISKFEAELKWNEENPHVMSFLTLVERRFMS